MVNIKELFEEIDGQINSAITVEIAAQFLDLEQFRSLFISYAIGVGLGKDPMDGISILMSTAFQMGQLSQQKEMQEQIDVLTALLIKEQNELS